jgi:hypothetical protein
MAVMRSAVGGLPPLPSFSRRIVVTVAVAVVVAIARFGGRGRVFDR